MTWTGGFYDPIPLHTIRERLHEVKGQRVFLRVDLNLPTDPDDRIVCDYRIRRAVGLVEVLSRLGCRVIVASHFGRPHGLRNPKLSLAPLVAPFARQLQPSVTFLPDCIGREVEQAIDNADAGSVFLLENLRFHPGEDEADPEFAEQLARLADCYINDAFSVSHRYHASTVLLPQLLPAYAGPAFVNEYQRSVALLEAMRPPVVVVSGGVKLDKLAAYSHLIARTDALLLGSGFAAALHRRPELIQGGFIGRTVLPIDFWIKTADGRLEEVTWDQLEPNTVPIDIGPKTIELYREKMASAGTLLFNGSLGGLPSSHPCSSHHPMVEAFVASKGIKVVCGGTGVSLFINSNTARKVNFVFPGGGAILNFLGDQSNPAIMPLALPTTLSSMRRVAPSYQFDRTEG